MTVGYHSQADHSTRFDRGEPVDVFLTDSAAIDEIGRTRPMTSWTRQPFPSFLIKRGKVGGRPHGPRAYRHRYRRAQGCAQAPDVSSLEALKRALLEAMTVGHAAPSGGSITAAHIQGVFQQLGIAAEVMPKVKLAAGGLNGRVSVLVSSGEAEMGLQQVSEQPLVITGPAVQRSGACRTKPWMRG